MNSKRYHHSLSGLMVEAADGDYVRFVDSQALLSLNAELLEALESIVASADAGNAAILDRLLAPARAAIAKARSAS